MTALERAISALEFYANTSAWDDDGGQHVATPAEIDRGRRAREALAELGQPRPVNPARDRSAA